MWIGPFTVKDLLENCLIDNFPKPPDNNSVYLISEKKWINEPNQGCVPLYVGSNTGIHARFRTRIGDLIADIFGFFGDETGHHSGGQSIYNYCNSNNIHPKNLYIGWLDNCQCVRCSENLYYDTIKPSLNVKKPNRCIIHQ